MPEDKNILSLKFQGNYFPKLPDSDFLILIFLIVFVKISFGFK